MYNFYLCLRTMAESWKKDLNRIKTVLAEKHRISKWLSEQLVKGPTTVSKCCINQSQPTL